jgi:nucleoside-diphosphate-sugar epimerase
VDDLVAGLIALMEGSYDKPVNLGNPEKYSIEVSPIPI